MKYIKLVVLILICSNCKAQETITNTLVERRIISDLSTAPIYTKLTEETDGVREWKPEYAHLDDIEISGITYMSDGLKVKGLLMQPKKAGKYPCIIYNRGGNRDFGQLSLSFAMFRLGGLVKEGYVVIASQYRGNDGGEGQEEFGGKDVNDVLALFDALEEVEKADTDNIGMYGWSRGGMMTYLTLPRTDKIKAAVVGGAPADKTVIDRPSMEQHVYAELIPNYWENKEEELKKRSAVFWADKFPKNVPILMLHGNADWRVKPENSLKLAMEFEKHRIPYRLVMYEGGDHGIKEHREEVEEEILAWFDKYLKQNAPLPVMEYHGR